MACAPRTPAEPTPTPGPTPTPVRVSQEDWEDVRIHSVCLKIDQTFVELPDQAPEEMAPYLAEGLGSFGVIAVNESSSCDAAMVVSITLRAIDQEYESKPTVRVCYAGSSSEGIMSLRREGLPTITVKFYQLDIPPMKIIECINDPANTNFSNSWELGLNQGIARLWGSELLFNALDGDVDWLQNLAFTELPDMVSSDALIPALILSLEAENWSARRDAANALGAYGWTAKQAVPVLTHCLDDEKYLVRYACLDALAKMKVHAVEAVPALIDALSDSELQERTVKTLQAITGENFDKDQMLGKPGGKGNNRSFCQV